jgi:hypothetical protein
MGEHGGVNLLQQPRYSSTILFVAGVFPYILEEDRQS